MKLLLLLLLIAAVRVHGLGCNSTEFKAGGRCCPKCHSGEYVGGNCTEFDSTNCQTCGEETYMNESTAQTWCHKCHICEVHSGLRVQTSCNKTSDSVCEPQEGFYCTDVKGNNCVRAQKHRKCEKGQHIKLNGTSSADTECSNCTDWTFNPLTQYAECKEQIILATVVIVGVVVIIGGVCFICWRKKSQTIEGRRGEEGFPAEIPGEEAIALNPVNTPNIRADEVHSTEETRGTA